MNRFTVEREPDGIAWCVVDMQTDEIIAAGFASNSEAWRWIDESSDQALADEERRRRIDTAFY